MSETSLGRAMTPDELEYLSKAFLDISAFDYKNEPVFDRKYFKAKYPGFTDDVIDILVLFEKGIRFKEFKQLLEGARSAAKGARGDSAIQGGRVAVRWIAMQDGHLSSSGAFESHGMFC